METREDWVKKVSDMMLAQLGESQDDLMEKRISFSFNEGQIKFDEDAFIDVCGHFGADLVHLLERLNTKDGFSSTIKNMSFNDRVTLANEITAQLGGKMLLRICSKYKSI